MKSSRSGRFRSILFTSDELHSFTHEFINQISPYLCQWKKQEISSAQMATIYVLHFVKIAKKNLWRSGKINEKHRLTYQCNIKLSILSEDLTISEILATTGLRGLPLRVNQMLLEWLSGRVHLELLENVPSPIEVLKMQAKGHRPVTIITDPLKINSLILNKRDALSFIVHDLEHVEKFYFDQNTFSAQVGFYKSLLLTITNPKIIDAKNIDEKFKKEYEYSISDMNAYCYHQLQYLCSALFELEKRTNCSYKNDFFPPSIYTSDVLNLIDKTYFKEPLSKEEILKLQVFYENFSADECIWA